MTTERAPVEVVLKREGNDVILTFRHESEEDADALFYALAMSIKNRTPFTMFAKPPH